MVGDALDPPTIWVASNFPNIIDLAVLDAEHLHPFGEWEGMVCPPEQLLSTSPQFRHRNDSRATEDSWYTLADTSSYKSAEFGHQYGLQGRCQQCATDRVHGERIRRFFLDVSTTGGAIEMYLGNQHHNTRNIQITGASTAIKMNFDWLWTLQNVRITNCDIGIDTTSVIFVNQAVGSVVVLESVISATQGIVRPYTPGLSSPQTAGTLVLETVDFTGS
jgi:hypothetical protein